MGKPTRELAQRELAVSGRRPRISDWETEGIISGWVPPTPRRYQAGVEGVDRVMGSRIPVSDVAVMPGHYARFPLEPIRFIEENRLSPLQGKIVKYVCRYDAKNGVEDLYKAKRCLEMLIKKVLGDPDWWKAPEEVSP